MKSFFLLAFVLISFNCFSATVTWDGGAGTHNWGDATNWDTNMLPAVGDDVIISSDSVVLNTSTTVRSLTVNSSKVLNVLFGFILEINGSTDVGLLLGGATVYNNGTIRIIDPTEEGIYGFNPTIYNFGLLYIEFQSGPCVADKQGIALRSGGYFFNGSLGLVKIKNSPTEAILSTVEGDFINSGDIELEGNCGGIKVGSLVDFYNNSGASIKIHGKGAGLYLGGSLFDNSGTITIDSLREPGILQPVGVALAAGDFVNSNLIEIKNTDYFGFQILIASSFSNTGTIQIDSTGSSGFTSNEDLQNSGNILISNSGFYGLHHSKFLTNSGTISVSNTASVGIFNYNLGGILNLGTLNVHNTSNHGISCDRDLTNQGDINISQSGGIGLVVSGDLTNESIINTDTSTLAGLSVDGDMINTQILNVNHSLNTGIITSGRVSNSGDITIENSFSKGLYATDTLINSGSLRILNTAEEALHLFQDSSPLRFENSGDILLGDSDKGGFLMDGGQFYNDGNLRIQEVNAGHGLHLMNLSSGVVNNGSIDISQTDSKGIYYQHFQAFLNDNNGIIEVDSTGSEGISLEGPLNNLGHINIENTAGFGISAVQVTPSSSLSILNSGTMLVDTDGPEGIRLEDFGFENEGELTLNAPVALSLERTEELNRFWNHREGVLTVNSGLSFQDTLSAPTSGGVNLNDGLIDQEDFLGINTFKNFENNGVFVDRGDKLTAFTTGFTNSGIIVKPQVGAISKDIKEMDIIHAAAKPAFTVGTSWFDPLDTGGFPSSVGTYSPSDQSFKPRGVNAGSLSGLKLTVSYSPMSLIHEITIPVIKKSCSQYYTMSFTGSNSDDWHTPENWDNGRLPDPCSTVTIPSGMSVRIPGGTYARTYRFLSETGSVYEAEAGAVLENLK